MAGIRLNTRGFTLVETLVVVAVITVLSAIAIPSLVSMQRSTSIDTFEARQHAAQPWLYR